MFWLLFLEKNCNFFRDSEEGRSVSFRWRFFTCAQFISFAYIQSLQPLVGCRVISKKEMVAPTGSRIAFAGRNAPLCSATYNTSPSFRIMLSLLHSNLRPMIFPTIAAILLWLMQLLASIGTSSGFTRLTWIIVRFCSPSNMCSENLAVR